jgi:hypothetical protein
MSPVGNAAAPPPSTSPLRRPARVDADLADKSEYVQAAVMARREEEARKAAERLEEVRAAERAKAAAEAAKDGFKATIGPKLKEWSEVCYLEWLVLVGFGRAGCPVRREWVASRKTSACCYPRCTPSFGPARNGKKLPFPN